MSRIVQRPSFVWRVVAAALLFAGGGTGCGGTGPGSVAGAPPVHEVLEHCPAQVAPAPEPGANLHRVTLADPVARCNDGSPAVMFVARAATGDTGQWLLFLKGGGKCESYESCAARWCDTPEFMSSRGQPTAIRAPGIFQLEGLSSWNRVYFDYCSSDLWSGQNDAAVQQDADGGPPYSLRFLGHRILEAGLVELELGAVSDDGVERLPRLTSATRILFTGSSAGSAGAQDHADWVRARFDPAQTRFEALFDSVIHPDYARSGDDAVRAAYEAVARPFARWTESDAGWNRFYEPSCASIHPGEEIWRCVDPGHVLANHVGVRFLAREDLSDPYFAQASPVSRTPEEHLGAAREALLALRTLPATAEETVTEAPAVFGPWCGTHVALLYPEVTEDLVDDAQGKAWSLASAAASWLGDGEFTAAVDDPLARTSSCH